MLISDHLDQFQAILFVHLVEVQILGFHLTGEVITLLGLSVYLYDD